jgi:ribosome-associated protein
MNNDLDARKIAYVASQAANEKKAIKVTILGLSKISVIADYFIICSGMTSVHVRAIVDHIIEKLDEIGVRLCHVEGAKRGRWILLDYGSVVVHVFHRIEREFYDLERLWGDAETIMFGESEDEDDEKASDGRRTGKELSQSPEATREI